MSSLLQITVSLGCHSTAVFHTTGNCQFCVLFFIPQITVSSVSWLLQHSCLVFLITDNCQSWLSQYSCLFSRGPHLLNIVVPAVADGLFGLCGSERFHQRFISTLPHPTPPPLPFPVPDKPYGFCGRKAPWEKKRQKKALPSTTA